MKIFAPAVPSRWFAIGLLLLTQGLLFGTPGQAQARDFSASEEQVLQAYLAYYGRPVDPAGLSYWTQQLDAAGGALDAIIQAFGESNEFNARYGSLSDQALVDGLYQQLLGRAAEPAGLAFYVDRLSAGEATLQSIALDVIFGATNEDALTVDNRLEVAKHYISALEQHAGPPPAVPAETLAGFVSSFTADPATLTPSIDALIAAQPVLNGPADQAEDYQDLEITEPVHLQGAGSADSILDGGGWTRLLEVRASVGAPGALVSDLTLSGGFSAYGGAILNQAALTLTDSQISDNNAVPDAGPTGYGGGVWNEASGSLSLSGTTFSGNGAHQGGGGIYSAGAITDTGSTFTDNLAGTVGGGIFSVGTLELTGTNLLRNAANDGGALASQEGGSATLRNCQINNNQATGLDLGGGGLLNDLGTLELIDSTLSGNSSAFAGGGFSNNNPSGLVVLSGTSISNNSAVDGPGFVNFGSIQAQNASVTDACTNHASLQDLGGNSIACGS